MILKLTSDVVNDTSISEFDQTTRLQVEAFWKQKLLDRVQKCATDTKVNYLSRIVSMAVVRKLKIKLLTLGVRDLMLKAFQKDYFQSLDSRFLDKPKIIELMKKARFSLGRSGEYFHWNRKIVME